MKQYVGISRDHSGSMYSLAASARDDYNELTKTLQTNSRKFLIDTTVSVVECGILNKNTYHTENKFVVDTMDVNTIVPLSEYETTGRNTPKERIKLNLQRCGLIWERYYMLMVQQGVD